MKTGSPDGARRVGGSSSRPLRVLTWHVHGSYLLYLSQIRHELYLPVREDGRMGYGGRAGSFPWPPNVHEIPAEDVRHAEFDVIVYQAHVHWREDRHSMLSPAQRELPQVFIEHDPPREHPTDTRHPVDDPDVLLVHCTHFNRLMWDSGRTPTTVIPHGVTVPDGVRYTGELDRGIVVVNNIASRGRRLGADVFAEASRHVPLDLVGMGATEAGGIGEVPHHELPAFEARYRFFFNPIRYTSLGLAVCEAMMLGMPIVGLATTEMVTAIEDGESGFLHTDPAVLVDRMHALLADADLARAMGENARRRALERFHISRFVRDWETTLEEVTGRVRGVSAVSAGGTTAP